MEILIVKLRNLEPPKYPGTIFGELSSIRILRTIEINEAFPIVSKEKLSSTTITVRKWDRNSKLTKI